MTSVRKKSENAPLLEETVETYGSDSGSKTNCPKFTGYKERTPLPWKQLMTVFFLRLAEPIAYTQVFPYINQMMEDIGAGGDSSKTGYYSGAVESMFAVAELLTVLRWGRLSDKLGRKPVILTGLTGAMLMTLLFGLSKSFMWAFVTRSLSGALSGNVPVLISSVGDITDDTNQAQAYAIFGLAANIAQVAGPAIGGTFANPAITFPDSLGKIKLLKIFPYLLPCLVASTITLTALFIGSLMFKETVKRDAVSEEQYLTPSNHTDAKDSAYHLATAPLLFSVLLPFSILSVLNTSMIAIFSLFAYTPIHQGGLSRDPEEIGFAIASSGIIGATIQVIILPRLQARYGTLTLYRFFMSLWPLIYFLFPVTNAIARRTYNNLGIPGEAEEDGYPTAPLGSVAWFFVILILSLNRLASMSYSLNLILTKNATPSTAVLGTVFAISHLVNCFSRAIGPAFVSSLFALSAEKGVLGGQLVWVIMCMISILGVWTTFQARDGSREK